MDYAKKLFESCMPVTETGCWIWMKTCDRKGYGQTCLNGKRIRAHRASFLVYKGAIPDGLCVLHKCDTPSCINTAHLFLGTVADNNKDAGRKGRSKKLFGESNGASKLTACQVKTIRKDKRTLRAIAKDYGVSGMAISYIKRRIKWRHL